MTIPFTGTASACLSAALLALLSRSRTNRLDLGRCTQLTF